jgi:FkbH-like protein
MRRFHLATRSRFHLSQRAFSEEFVSRLKVTQASPPFARSVHLNVIRNETLEPFMSHAQDISSTFGINLQISYSEYSDLPRFPNTQYDRLLVWLNWNRYLPEGISALLDTILIALDNEKLNNMWVLEPSNINPERKLQILRNPKAQRLPWLSLPTDSSGFTPWRNSGYSREEIQHVVDFVGVTLAQQASRLECRAIVLDFDNTLYPGVFAEGYKFVPEDDEPFLSLRKCLKQLSDKGVVIVGATKNNEQDVNTIFSSNVLSPLQHDDFVFVHSGWTSKTNAIAKLIPLLNLDTSNMLFIDDNVRELAEVSEVYPDLLCLNAADPLVVLFLLQNRILFNLDKSRKTITQRKQDLRARASRVEIFKTNSDSDAFLYKYNTKVRSRNAISSADRDRAISLFNKTNQFNFSLERHEEFDFQSINLPYRIIVSDLRDDLSDSGTIAAMAIVEHPGTLEIIEFCISCRALGRGVEKFILLSMLSEVPNFENDAVVSCRYTDQVRNQVAKSFLQEYFSFDEKWFLNTRKLLDQTNEGIHILE